MPTPEPVTVGGGSDSSHTAFGRKVEVSGVGVGRPRTGALHYTAPSETGGVDEHDEGVGATNGGRAGLTEEQMTSTPRNAPCPCGSGKKFKMCHGRR